MAFSPPAPPSGKSSGAGTVVPLHPKAHAKKKAHSSHEDEGDEEGGEHGDGNWIVSYADMMTLLCVFFVLMYSLADPNPKKIEQLKKETTQYFGGEYKLPYQGLVDKFKKVIQEQGLQNQVDIESDEAGVNVTFRGTFFFESGKAEVLPAGEQLLGKLGDVIRKEAPGFKIVVEGHTDDTPIVSPMFPSNWELSGARASRVIRMFEGMGFSRKLLTAIGYADTRPVVPDRDANGTVISQNQAQNRRVVLKVLQAGLGGDKKPKEAPPHG